MDIEKEKIREIDLLEDNDFYEESFYEENCANLEEKINEISYDFMIFLKKYTKDECISIAENLSYIDLIDFIESCIN